MRLLAQVLLYTLMVTLVLTKVRAHDAHDHPILTGWAEDQQVMPQARGRFACVDPALFPLSTCSCCNGAEIVRGKFRLSVEDGPDGYPFEEWEWLNPKTNKWQLVPEDIIHWGEPTPDKRAVAFEYPIGSGVLRCFFPPQEAGG